MGFATDIEDDSRYECIPSSKTNCALMISDFGRCLLHHSETLAYCSLTCTTVNARTIAQETTAVVLYVHCISFIHTDSCNRCLDH